MRDFETKMRSPNKNSRMKVPCGELREYLKTQPPVLSSIYLFAHTFELIFLNIAFVPIKFFGHARPSYFVRFLTLYD